MRMYDLMPTIKMPPRPQSLQRSATRTLSLQGIIHRDIKPENLLMAADGSVRLADFGLAIDTSQETPKARVGTLDYFAPEASTLISSGQRRIDQSNDTPPKRFWCREYPHKS